MPAPLDPFNSTPPDPQGQPLFREVKRELYFDAAGQPVPVVREIETTYGTESETTRIPLALGCGCFVSKANPVGVRCGACEGIGLVCARHAQRCMAPGCGRALCPAHAIPVSVDQIMILCPTCLVAFETKQTLERIKRFVLFPLRLFFQPPRPK
jgi:hypothetical protein